LISNSLVEKTALAFSSSTQGMCIDEHPKNSTTEEQQDTSRTNENTILNTENSNRRKN
ncbi:1545_t:CDS:1, partial [Scutellospora calospora]